MNIGARGLFTAHAVQTPLRWIRTVAAEADHPLLERLGVQRLSITDALADPALRMLVEEAADLVEDGAGEEVDATGLAEEVLALLGADSEAVVPEWLSRLPLPADDGDLRSATSCSSSIRRWPRCSSRTIPSVCSTVTSPSDMVCTCFAGSGWGGRSR